MHQRQRLLSILAEHHDRPKLELSGLGNHQIVQVFSDLVRKKGPKILFFDGDKIIYTRNATNSSRTGLPFYGGDAQFKTRFV